MTGTLFPHEPGKTCSDSLTNSALQCSLDPKGYAPGSNALIAP
jgi:hypothetical protein